MILPSLKDVFEIEYFIHFVFKIFCLICNHKVLWDEVHFNIVYVEEHGWT